MAIRGVSNSHRAGPGAPQGLNLEKFTHPRIVGPTRRRTLKSPDDNPTDPQIAWPQRVRNASGVSSGSGVARLSTRSSRRTSHRRRPEGARPRTFTRSRRMTSTNSNKRTAAHKSGLADWSWRPRHRALRGANTHHPVSDLAAAGRERRA
jgi:hypothetical protein